MKKILIIIILFTSLCVQAQENNFGELRRDKSERGMEVGLGVIASPFGYNNIVNGNKYIHAGAGGELDMLYRINGAFSFGLGINLALMWSKEYTNLTMPPYMKMRVNLKESDGRSPYISFALGFDWLVRINESTTETFIPGTKYYNSSFVVMTPAFGYDFRLRGCKLFVEARAHYRVTDMFMPALSAGVRF